MAIFIKNERKKKYGDLDKAYPIRKKLNKNHAKQM
jgi:hypothetical protein